MRDHGARDGAPRAWGEAPPARGAGHTDRGAYAQSEKFVARDHEVPDLVVLVGDDSCITVPDNARLNNPPLLKEDAETRPARWHAVVDADLLDLVAVPGQDAEGTPVGEDPFN